MAKKLNSFEFRGGVGAPKYPWDEWLDGDIWQLDEEDFGGTDAKYVAHQARNSAQRRFKKVKVSLDEKNQVVTLQAFDMTDEEIEETKVKLAERKEAQKAKRLAKAEKNGHAEPEEEEEETPAPRKRKVKK